MEAAIVERYGVAFKHITAAGVHGVNLCQLPSNLIKLFIGVLQARRILTQFRPDVLFFTGGYVAIPLALAAYLPLRKFKKPSSVLFVPDIEPGLALKTLARFADCIAITAEETKKYLPSSKKTILSGYPVRAAFYEGDRDKARRQFGLNLDLPVVVVFGGSLGARSINQALFSILPQLLEEAQVIHISGKFAWDEVQLERGKLEQQNLLLAQRYHSYAYLHDEMPQALQAADLVICRSGASTLGELPALGTAAILVPYPHAWRYQEINAAFLTQRGAAIMLKDADLMHTLLPTVLDCIRDSEKLKQMSKAMQQLAKPEAAKTIIRCILSYTDGGK